MTLKRFLIWLILLCVVPLVVLCVVVSTVYIQLIRADSEVNAQARLDNLVADLDSAVHTRIGGLQILALSPLGDDAARWPDLYHEAQGFYKSFGSHVVFAGTDFAMRFNTRMPYGATLPALPRPTGTSAALSALQSGKPAVGDLFMGPLANEPLIAIAVPAVRAGSVSHLLVTMIEAKQLQAALGRTALPAGWSATLFDSTGAIIAQRLPASAAYHRAGGSKRFVAKTGATPWSVALEAPITLFAAPATDTIFALLAATLAATLVAVVGGSLAARRLAKAVELLIHAPAHNNAPAADIAEIATAQRMLHELLDKREQAEKAKLESEQKSRAALQEAARELALSEARLRGIFESATDAILTADESQTIVIANPAAAHMFRCSLDQLAGLPLDRLIPTRYHAQHRMDVQAFGNTAVKSRHMGRRQDVMGLRTDGEEFPIDAAISHLSIGGRRLYTVILRDVTERKRTEAQVKESASALEQAYADLQALVSAQEQVQESERTRIARELHDDLQQLMAAVRMDLAAASRRLAADPGAAQAILTNADRLVHDAIASTRRLPMANCSKRPSRRCACTAWHRSRSTTLPSTRGQPLCTLRCISQHRGRYQFASATMA